MESLTQFSVFLINKPGVLAQVCRELGKAKVNIVALAMMDAVEHGVLRVIVADPERSRTVLKKLNIPMTETDVLCVPMSNKPGALADVCERLSLGHVVISYMYCTTGAAGGKALGIFKVPDIKKAIKVIEAHRGTGKDVKRKLRPDKRQPTPKRRAPLRR